MTDTAIRTADLRHMLNERRRELQEHVQSRIRGGRADRPVEGGDDLEHSDADLQGDIELALLQMRAETLTRIVAALVRLDAGQYGSCFECEGEISERRLRTLPFAVRCQACEERREQEQGPREATRSATQQPLALPGCRYFLRRSATRACARRRSAAPRRRPQPQSL